MYYYCLHLTILPHSYLTNPQSSHPHPTLNPVTRILAVLLFESSSSRLGSQGSLAGSGQQVISQDIHPYIHSLYHLTRSHSIIHLLLLLQSCFYSLLLIHALKPRASHQKPHTRTRTRTRTLSLARG